LYKIVSRFSFGAKGAKERARGSQARRKSLCEFAKRKRRKGLSPSADGDQRTRVGSVPPFEKGGRKLFNKFMRYSKSA
jgi:hypothetical protein